MDDSDPDGFGAGAEQSKGDPRVVLALTITWGLDFVGSLEFTPVNVATLAVLLFAVSYAVAS
jgi:hypothetical protein